MDNGLTEQDKDRIFQEETFRREVREQLEKGEGGNKSEKSFWTFFSGKSFWTFLNSAFCLWLLSSVFLGGISYLYTEWDERRTLAREQRERMAIAERDDKRTARKLDAEISSRFMLFVNSIEFKRTPDQKAFTFVHEPSVLKNAVVGIDDPTTTVYKVNVFPEYANRSLLSLLLDLQNVVPDTEKQEIELASKQTRLLQSVYLHAKQIEDEKDSEKTQQLENQQDADLLELDKAFNLKRWGQPFDHGTTSKFFKQKPLGTPTPYKFDKPVGTPTPYQFDK